MSEEGCLCKRWLVSIKGCLESEKFEILYRKGIQCVPLEEYEKIRMFHHREDALAGLLGKLLLRYAAAKITGSKWNEIKFDRTEKGKPYLAIPPNSTFGMNISHQGDYVAFVCSCTSNVGVDIMKLNNERNNMSADEYITSMSKSASVNELSMMRTQPTDAMKMTVFYRIWCLKEAILKATGEGIIKELNRLDFIIDRSQRYRQGSFYSTTTLKKDNVLQDQWIFEESFADANHVVAVCRDKIMPRKCIWRSDDDVKLFFSKITMETLLEIAEPINILPNNAADAYSDLMEKKRKTF